MKTDETSNDQPLALNGVIEKVSKVKSFKESLHFGKSSIQNASSRMKENISSSIHKKAEETTEFIDNVKNKKSKIKNLEVLLELGKSNLISSDATTSFYKYSKEKIILFDKDILGEPIRVTIKESSKAKVYCVKYNGYTPHLYPTYDEKDISGEIIYLDNEEIWYRDINKLTLGYNNGNSMDFHKVSLSDFSDFPEDNIIPYIKKYSAIIRSPKLNKLVQDTFILISNIIRISENYIIVKNKDHGYTIYVYNYSKQGFDALPLNRLPDIELTSYDTLLSTEILNFIRENQYSLESFEQKGNYIEYNTEIGRNTISVMRFKARP